MGYLSSAQSLTSSSTLTFEYSADEDDFMFLIDVNKYGTTTGPIGWTSLSYNKNTRLGHVNNIWYRKATTSEPSSVNLVCTTSKHWAQLVIFKGVDNTTPFDVTTVSRNSGNTTQSIAPAITPVTADALIFYINLPSGNGLVSEPGPLEVGSISGQIYTNYTYGQGASVLVPEQKYIHETTSSINPTSVTIALRDNGAGLQKGYVYKNSPPAEILSLLGRGGQSGHLTATSDINVSSVITTLDGKTTSHRIGSNAAGFIGGISGFGYSTNFQINSCSVLGTSLNTAIDIESDIISLSCQGELYKPYKDTGQFFLVGDGTNYRSFKVDALDTKPSGSNSPILAVIEVNGGFEKEEFGTVNSSVLQSITHFAVAGPAGITYRDSSVGVLHRLKTMILAGGSSTYPASFDTAALCSKTNSLRTVSNQNDQSENQFFFAQSVQLGNGTLDAYIDISGGSSEWLSAYDEANLRVNGQVTSNKIGFFIKAASLNTVKFENHTFNLGNYHKWEIDSSTSASAIYAESGSSVLNATVTLNDIGRALASMSFVSCKEIVKNDADLSGGCLISSCIDTNAITLTGTTQASLQLLIDDLANCRFTNNITAIRIEYTGTGNVNLTFDNIAWTDNTTDLHYNSTNTSELTAIMSNGSNASISSFSGAATRVTLSLPTGRFDFNGLLAGTQVVVCTAGTQTEVFRTNSSGTSESTPDLVTGSYDYTIYKADQFFIRETNAPIGSLPVTVNVNQEIDRAYAASSGLTYGTTATVNTTTKEFDVTVNTTPQNWYSFWKEAWIAESALVNTAFDLRPFGSSSFSLNNGYEFTSSSIQYLREDGFRYVDTSGNVTARYLAILTQNVPSGLQVRYQQVEGAAPIAAQNSGNANQVIQIFGDATHGNFDYTGHLVLKVQANGYREARFDAVETYGTLEESFYVAPLPVAQIEGLTLGDPEATGITITKEAAPVSYDAGDGPKDYSGTILDSGTNSGETILREFNWNLAQMANYQGFVPFNLPEIVVKNGSTFETAGGIVENDDTPALHGWFVTRDGTNPHPDFARFQADDGTYGAPLPTLNISGFTSGSRVRIYNATTGSDPDLHNAKVAGSSYAYTYTEGVEITAGDTIEIFTCFTDATNSYDGTAVAIATAGGFSVLVNEREYTDYAAKGIDGSAETEYVLDGTNLQLDISAPDNTWDIRNLSAWYRYEMFDSAIAIKSFFNALNTSNGVVYEFDTDKGNLLIDNLRADLALELSGYTLRRKDGLIPYLNPTTGGGHPEFKYRDDALAVETGVSGLTPPESALLSGAAKETTLTAIKGAGWTTETLKDIRDNAGSGLNEAGLHTGLDSYANKDDYKADVSNLSTDVNVVEVNGVAVTNIDDFKADVSEIDTVKANQAIINDNVKKGSTYPVISGPDTN